ncbi:hypothetical protein evm_015154 [Chilo suppressalis]|nr:hypothetical protein evm_015154 [Chilo suppressalis]
MHIHKLPAARAAHAYFSGANTTGGRLGHGWSLLTITTSCTVRYGPVAGHAGRIPNFGKTQVNPMGSVEPPACIQNAMMTKDKKPFTYTPGGLDLSQIRTPSMARRMARQRSLEEQEQAQGQYGGGGNYHPQGGPAPPPPPPPKVPAPPPPPPIVIEVPNSKSPKPIAPGERPEIVIPENPIGMLRKTNSPYHWEAEKAEMQKMGSVPKFQEKVPSPLTVKMPPATFSAQPQSYTPPGQNRQSYPYGNQNNYTPESPIHKPEAQYANQNYGSPNVNGSPPTREILQRQDSQFNKSPQPFHSQSPLNNGSPFSPSPNNNWRQPEKRDSPSNNSPNSPQFQRGPFSPNTTQQYSPNYQKQSPPSNSGPVFHTLPRAGQRNQDSFVNNSPNQNSIYNNVREVSPKAETTNSTPWRTSTLNRPTREPENLQNIYHNSQSTNQQPTYTPPWKTNDTNNNENTYIPPWVQERRNSGNQLNNQQYAPQRAQEHKKPQESYQPPWRSQESEQTAPTSLPNRNIQQEQPRYQSTMSIPVTPKKQNTQPEYNNTVPHKEVVYVNAEPVYFCPESPKSIPPWVKTQKEKTKTPPPAWCQKPLDGRRSAPRELATPPRDTNQEPEWVRKSNEMQRNVREVISPPKYQQPVQPNWSTRPSENRKSLPRDTAPQSPGNRVIPIQMEVSGVENRNQGRQMNNPQLRVVTGAQQNPNSQGVNRAQAPYSQPTQRIMRVLSPQLVRMDEAPTQPELPTLNRTFQPCQDNQPKTRIIPIQIEGGNGGANKSFGGRF